MMPKMNSGPTRPLRKPKALPTYLLTRPPKPEFGFPGSLLETLTTFPATLDAMLRPNLAGSRSDARLMTSSATPVANRPTVVYTIVFQRVLSPETAESVGVPRRIRVGRTDARRMGQE